MFHSPEGPRLILSVCETPRLDGDKGRGPLVWSPEVFSLAAECFQCGARFCAEFQREAVIPETGKCYKQYGNTWPLVELLLPPPAPLPSVAPCCQERVYTTDRVCVFVYNNRTRSISQRRFDCADVAHVAFFFLIAALL